VEAVCSRADGIAPAQATVCDAASCLATLPPGCLAMSVETTVATAKLCREMRSGMGWDGMARDRVAQVLRGVAAVVPAWLGGYHLFVPGALDRRVLVVCSPC